MQPQQHPRQILRLDQVEAKCGYKRSQLYLKIARNEFPRPIPLGDRAVGWISEQIEAWIDSRIQAAQQPEQQAAKAARAAALKAARNAAKAARAARAAAGGAK